MMDAIYLTGGILTSIVVWALLWNPAEGGWRDLPNALWAALAGALWPAVAWIGLLELCAWLKGQIAA